MRTRKKKYLDYGLTEKDVKNTFRFLRRMKKREKEEVKRLLEENLPEYIAETICRALIEGKGYYALAAETQMLCVKADFYGYRRKAIYIIHEWREKNGKK